MAVVGYFEGTDPLILTNLAIAGHDTLPLGNGFDNYGKYVGHLTRDDHVSVVVGYFHKVLPTSAMTITIKSVLSACLDQGIPIVLICGQDKYGKAKEMLGDVAGRVRLADPAQAEKAILSLL